MFRSWDHIPCVSLDDLAPAGALVVIAPHPDDETLACGGLIASALDGGREVRVIVVTDGSGSHPGSLEYSPGQVAALRERELDAAMESLGLNGAHLLKLALPDGRLCEAGPAALANRVLAALSGVSVGSIFVPGEDDPHPDHRTAALAAVRLADTCGARLWRYPVRAHVIATFLEAPADLVQLEVSAVLKRKRAALACHASQLGDLIQDDPQGFYLNPDDLHQHLRASELYRDDSVSNGPERRSGPIFPPAR